MHRSDQKEEVGKDAAQNDSTSYNATQDAPGVHSTEGMLRLDGALHRKAELSDVIRYTMALRNILIPKTPSRVTVDDSITEIRVTLVPIWVGTSFHEEIIPSACS